ncbi:MAG: SAM-dependent methyltransferase [Bacilli bacterium]|nr:SAM-dependent methyltransferase [Bacilli bacterium]
MKISARLAAAAAMVPEGAYLADVGSDHAYLPIFLMEKGIISFAQAIDNKMAPYLRMKRNVEDSGYASRIACSLSSGLDDLQPDVDTLAICGVGGLLTCEILEKRKEKLDGIKTIILDPHRDLQAVRKRVSALGYHLVDEEMVYEGKIYYTIMKWEAGAPSKPYNLDELLFGPIIMKKRSEVFHDYLLLQEEKVNHVLNSVIPKDKREAYLELYRQIRRQLKKYN